MTDHEQPCNDALPRDLEQELNDSDSALASELSFKLDVEAGLAAIVSADRPRLGLRSLAGGARESQSADWDSLTEVERNVALLVSHGLSNPEIAKLMSIRVGTVAAHLRRTFRKLSVTSRVELAQLVPVLTGPVEAGTSGHTAVPRAVLNDLLETRFFTVGEIARIARVSKMTVYREVHAGRLDSVRVGRSFRIPAESVRRWLGDPLARIAGANRL